MIARLFAKFWPYIAAALLFVVAMLTMRQNGQLRERVKQAERTVQKDREMRDAGDAVATSRDAISERLRSGTF